jgi:hypothetical protein
MLSTVLLGSVSIGSVACGADPAMLLAPLDDLTADATPARVELPGAWLVGVVAVAPVVVFIDLAPEHIGSSLESCEL